MFTIDIGCVLVNELSRLQIFTSVKDQNAIFFKFFQYCLELNLSLSVARHIFV